MTARPQPATPSAATPAGAAAARDLEKLREQTEKFSSILLHQILGAMRKGMPENPYLDKGAGSKTFLDLLDERYADILAHRKNGLGISDMLYRQLSRSMERQDAAAGSTAGAAAEFVA